MSYKPEPALKRAKEIIHAPAPDEETVRRNKRAALHLLHEVLEPKRNRSWRQPYEDVMMMYVDICVELQLSLMAKDGLHQYRNLTLHSSRNMTPQQKMEATNSLERVINHLVKLAEERATNAKQMSNELSQAVAEKIDDLEAAQTPESIILSTMTDDDHSDRVARTKLVPWLKFLWETYRTILEILRNNSKLEHVYHASCMKAFGFCKTYTRRTEFRRLCEILRTHMTNIQNHEADLAAGTSSKQLRGWLGWDDRAIEFHLQTRFAQLEVAAAMELWAEAFRTIEDIHGVMSINSEPPKAFLMAAYYERLTKIFWVSENYLFHAYAWYKFYVLSRNYNTKLSSSKLQVMASSVVLAALSIPLISSIGEEAGGIDGAEVDKEKSQRMTKLLGFSTTPSRETLLRELVVQDVIGQTVPEVRGLYHHLVTQFHPLSIVAAAKPGLEFLRGHKELQMYVPALEKLLVQQLLNQLSSVYSTVRIDHLTSLLDDLGVGSHEIEKLIVNSTKARRMKVQIDHQSRCLRFGEDILEGDRVRSQLSELSRRLRAVIQDYFPADKTAAERKKSERARLFQTVSADLDKHHQSILARKTTIEKRKEELERLQRERAKAEAQRQAEAVRLRKEQEKARLENEARMRELEKLQKLKDDKQIRETKQMLSRLGRDVDDMDDSDLGAVDRAALLRESRERAAREKEESERKLRDQAKRLDYIARATREAEQPILARKWEEELKTKEEKYKKEWSDFLSKSKAEWDLGRSEKARLARMEAFRAEFEKGREKRREAEYRAKLKEMKLKKKVQYLRQKIDRAIDRRERHMEELRRATEEEERLLEEELRAQEEEERREREEEEARRLADEALQREKERVQERERQLEEARALEAERELSRPSESEGTWKSRRQMDADRRPRPSAPRTAADSDDWTRVGPPAARGNRHRDEDGESFGRDREQESWRSAPARGAAASKERTASPEQWARGVERRVDERPQIERGERGEGRGERRADSRTDADRWGRGASQRDGDSWEKVGPPSRDRERAPRRGAEEGGWRTQSRPDDRRKERERAPRRPQADSADNWRSDKARPANADDDNDGFVKVERRGGRKD